MGEAFGLYRMGDDEALLPLISVANVACGFHASDFNPHAQDGAPGQAAPCQGRRAQGLPGGRGAERAASLTNTT